VGLDAAHFVTASASREIYFSIETDLFSERLGMTLQRGDLLSSYGRVVKRNHELLARFHPPPTPGPVPRDYGLDALYLWPGGEIWFSVEEGFMDEQLGMILPGDLLSDQGRVVMRNLELLAAFAPIEDLADFGLDAVFVVTEAAPISPGITAMASNGEVKLTFTSEPGVRYVVEYKNSLSDATWTTLGEVEGTPGSNATTMSDPGPYPTSRFYRVRVEE
jgi:hypothetical protein